MKQIRLFGFFSLACLLSINQSVFADIDTRLSFISNTHNSPSSGKGTLVLDVESKSDDGSSYSINTFQDAFQIDATLRGQNPIVSFSNQLFPAAGYTTTEDYRS